MSNGKNKSSVIKIIGSDVLVTAAIFVILVFVTAVMVNNGAIQPEYLKTLIMLLTVISPCISTVVIKSMVNTDYSIGVSLITAGILSIVLVAIPLCRKGSGISSGALLISTVLLIAGKVIPSVIKTSPGRNCKSKRRKK